jgi:hypothetical protein
MTLPKSIKYTINCVDYYSVKAYFENSTIGLGTEC